MLNAARKVILPHDSESNFTTENCGAVCERGADPAGGVGHFPDHPARVETVRIFTATHERDLRG